MTALTVLPGGGETAPPVTACPVCGAGHRGQCKILGRHLDRLRLLGRAERTIADRRYSVARLGRWLADPRSYDALGITGDGVCVLDAKPAHLAAWRASLDVSPSAIISYVSHARGMYRWAVDEGLIEKDPAGGLPVPRKPRRLPRPIAEKSLMRALESAPPRIRLWLVLAGWAGLRACEISGLLRESILDSRTPPVIMITAESSKGWQGERIIPLSGFVLGEIAAADLPGSGYAFRRHDGRAGPVPAYLISHLSNDHLHGLGIPDTLHSLRHRFATATYAHSRDLRAVQSLLGHASVTSTAGYAQFSDAVAVDAVESIPAPGRLHVVRDSGKGARSS